MNLNLFKTEADLRTKSDKLLSLKLYKHLSDHETCQNLKKITSILRSDFKLGWQKTMQGCQWKVCSSWTRICRFPIHFRVSVQSVGLILQKCRCRFVLGVEWPWIRRKFLSMFVWSYFLSSSLRIYSRRRYDNHLSHARTETLTFQ